MTAESEIIERLDKIIELLEHIEETVDSINSQLAEQEK
jgi:hypothetical protein